MEPRHPMPYATESDLDAGWDLNTVNLLTADPATGLRNESRVTAALAAATAMINSYVARRYPLPLNLSDDGIIVLRGICVDIAIGRLADSAGTMTDMIKDRVAAAMQYLRDVAAAKADVPVEPDPSQPGGALPAITPNEALIEAPPRLFTRAGLRCL